MKTADFIKKHCVGETCPDFDYDYGCRAYDGEECDAAFNYPRWRGVKMADRVTKLCERQRNNKYLLDIQTICFDCAKANGFVMKDKAVGVWTDRCEVCHERKPCTNLHHDWQKKGKSK